VRSAISPNDGRVAALVLALDGDDVPVAATWREVGAAAERLGLRRPSYGHVRRLVLVLRRRRALGDAAWAAVRDAGTALAGGRVPDAPALLLELRELKLAEELVFQEHKAFSAPAARAPPTAS
jgi:hypothetical protein